MASVPLPLLLLLLSVCVSYALPTQSFDNNGVAWNSNNDGVQQSGALSIRLLLPPGASSAEDVAASLHSLRLSAAAAADTIGKGTVSLVALCAEDEGCDVARRTVSSNTWRYGSVAVSDVRTTMAIRSGEGERVAGATDWDLSLF
jgi:hypothetical protein